MARISDEDRAKNKELLRETILILSNINDIEERSAKAKEQAMELFKKLDNVADGEK